MHIQCFPQAPTGGYFHLLIGAEQLAYLMQNVAISLIFINETPTIKA